VSNSFATSFNGSNEKLFDCQSAVLCEYSKTDAVEINIFHFDSARIAIQRHNNNMIFLNEFLIFTLVVDLAPNGLRKRNEDYSKIKPAQENNLTRTYGWPLNTLNPLHAVLDPVTCGKNIVEENTREGGLKNGWQGENAQTPADIMTRLQARHNR